MKSPLRDDGAAGGSPPRRASRIIVATIVATISIAFTYAEHLRLGRSSDFGQVWFGARALLEGLNPYALIGPGRAYDWDWILYYPATTLVAALPFSLLPEMAASLVFVWLTAWLLAYAVTQRGFHGLFLIASASFIVSVRAAQFSPLFAAALAMPSLGWALGVKPNIGLAIATTTSSTRLVLSAALVGVLLAGIAFWMLPGWVGYWLQNVRAAYHMIVPVARPGGFLVLLALLRWRRPEARLIPVLACLPQTGSWYESLPLLLTANSRRECQVLSMISSIGYIASANLVHKLNEAQINRDVGTFLIWFAYIPAVVLVLRRANTGSPPALWVISRHVLRNVSLRTHRRPLNDSLA